MFKTFLTLLTYASWFYLGRLSYRFWQDARLEHDREEILRGAKELGRIEAQLEERDAHIRKKWQEMVNDIALYQASQDPEASKTWSKWDDVYLNSWKSAEK